uniref:Pentraxin 4 n=1 Tax=Cyanoderma ruficeps TaxID=181631 RepID=A0A8C3R4U0_9PASS
MSCPAGTDHSLLPALPCAAWAVPPALHQPCAQSPTHTFPHLTAEYPRPGPCRGTPEPRELWAGASRPRRALARGLGAGSPGAEPCQGWLRISSRWRLPEGTPRGLEPALPCRQKASGGGMARMALPVCLILAAALDPAWGCRFTPHHPTPLQFLRLQEVTLNHLQSIASNYNISYNIDGRFQALAEQAEAADAARAALGAELARLATAGRRLRRRLKRLEGTVGALNPPHGLLTYPASALAEASTKSHGLPDTARSRGSQLEQQPPGPAVRSTPSPRRPKTRRWQQLRQEEGHRLPPPAPQQPGEGRYGPPVPVPTSPACRTGAILLFPNTSAEHRAVLGLGPHRGLRAMSLCAWLATPAPRLGALLSYATEDRHSELGLHGHGGDRPGSARFIVGDGQFRELPVVLLLDGKWHHLCLTWSSSQGQYRFYVDRRLLAAGSGFQQGYEIPTGGSLVLGWGQDSPNMDLGTAEAFVGHLAGFALWRRALLPGEVARMATGRGMPRGPLLTLADASLQGGVRRVACPCLQRCL